MIGVGQGVSCGGGNHATINDDLVLADTRLTQELFGFLSRVLKRR